MPNLNFHPRSIDQRALGELLPGFYDVPQNPVAVSAHGITYTPRIGELLPGAYTVPQNPVRDYSRGTVKMLGTSGGPTSGDCGMGCACSGTINGAPAGMGDINSDWAAGNYTAVITDTLFTVGTFAVPTWMAAMVGIAAFTMLRSGKRR